MTRSTRWDATESLAELPTTFYHKPVSRAGLHRLCVDCLNSPVVAATDQGLRCEPCDHKRARRMK